MKNTRIGRLITASSAESEDIWYGSGFYGPDEFIYAETPEEHMIVVSILEFSRAKNEARKDISVRQRGEFFTNDRTDKTPFLISFSKKLDIGRWIVPGTFPVAYADLLRKFGLEVEIQAGDFFPERAIKKPAEIACIRAVELITQDTMCMLRDILKSAHVNDRKILEKADGEPMTCDYLRREIELEFKRRGCSASRSIVACGKDSAAPHCLGSGPVFAGEFIVADLFPRSDENGYWGDMTRTFLKGIPSPNQTKMFDSVLNAANLALKFARAKVTGAELHLLAEKAMEADGFQTGHDKNGNPKGFIHGLGHGVGLAIHENPRVSTYNPLPLKPGHVVSIEPGLYDCAIGGVRLEDLIVITEDGCENFCSMEKVLPL